MLAGFVIFTITDTSIKQTGNTVLSLGGTGELPY